MAKTLNELNEELNRIKSLKKAGINRDDGKVSLTGNIETITFEGETEEQKAIREANQTNALDNLSAFLGRLKDVGVEGVKSVPGQFQLLAQQFGDVLGQEEQRALERQRLLREDPLRGLGEMVKQDVLTTPLALLGGAARGGAGLAEGASNLLFSDIPSLVYDKPYPRATGLQELSQNIPFLSQAAKEIPLAAFLGEEGIEEGLALGKMLGLGKGLKTAIAEGTAISALQDPNVQEGQTGIGQRIGQGVLGTGTTTALGLPIKALEGLSSNTTGTIGLNQLRGTQEGIISEVITPEIFAALPNNVQGLLGNDPTIVQGAKAGKVIRRPGETTKYNALTGRVPQETNLLTDRNVVYGKGEGLQNQRKLTGRVPQETRLLPENVFKDREVIEGKTRESTKERLYREGASETKQKREFEAKQPEPEKTKPKEKLRREKKVSAKIIEPKETPKLDTENEIKKEDKLRQKGTDEDILSRKYDKEATAKKVLTTRDRMPKSKINKNDYEVVQDGDKFKIQKKNVEGKVKDEAQNQEKEGNLQRTEKPISSKEGEGKTLPAIPDKTTDRDRTEKTKAQEEVNQVEGVKGSEKRKNVEQAQKKAKTEQDTVFKKENTLWPITPEQLTETYKRNYHEVPKEILNEERFGWTDKHQKIYDDLKDIANRGNNVYIEYIDNNGDFREFERRITSFYVPTIKKLKPDEKQFISIKSFAKERTAEGDIVSHTQNIDPDKIINYIEITPTFYAGKAKSLPEELFTKYMPGNKYDIVNDLFRKLDLDTVQVIHKENLGQELTVKEVEIKEQGLRELKKKDPELFNRLCKG